MMNAIGTTSHCISLQSLESLEELFIYYKFEEVFSWIQSRKATTNRNSNLIDADFMISFELYSFFNLSSIQLIKYHSGSDHKKP